MFSSQYDGGFTASQLDSGPSPAKNREFQGTVPISVKQISQASHTGDDKSNFQIDGVDVTNVKMVGMVLDKTTKVTDITFILDDGTGRIGCKRWINEAFDRKQMEAVEDGMYVRLIGHLRSFRGNAEVVAFSLWPVTDFNEVIHHFVECIHNHARNTISQLKGDSLSQSQMDSSQTTSVKTEPNSYTSTPSSQIGVDGLKGVDQMVLDYLQQPPSLAQEKGVHRDEIARHLKLPVDKILESITCLEEEGLIYSTIDEFHYKSTAA